MYARAACPRLFTTYVPTSERVLLYRQENEKGRHDEHSTTNLNIKLRAGSLAGKLWI